MNRLHALDLPEIVPASSSNPPAIKIESGVFSRPKVDLPCSFFAPLHYEPNYAYPLLVWLHGPADDENQLRRIMPLVSMRNYVGLSIRGTRAVTGSSGRRAFTWSAESGHFEQAEERLFDAIDLARERFNIAPERIFLGGYEVGGTMAFRMAMAHPRSFGGVLSVCGEFPTDDTPLRWLDAVRRLPMFLAYGRDSESFPVSQVCEAIRLFHIARLKVNLFQYPCPQQLTTKMLEDMDRWIMEQVTGTHATVEA
jgi:phospholipase/carboxylesterase